MNHRRSVSITTAIDRNTTDLTIYKPGTKDSNSLIPGYTYSGMVTELQLFPNLQLPALIQLWVSDGNTKFIIRDNLRISADGTNINLGVYYSFSGSFTLSPNFSIGITNLYPETLTEGSQITIFGFASEEGVPSSPEGVVPSKIDWGSVAGIISNQPDLFAALQGKMPNVEPGRAQNVLASDGTQWKSVALSELQPSPPAPPPTQGKQLTFTSEGDTNGVLYWLGTNEGQEAWSNPHTLQKVLISASSYAPVGYENYAPTYAQPEYLCDRNQNSYLATREYESNRWIKIDFLTHKLKPNYYSFRDRVDSNQHPTNWKLQVSNDDSHWTDLDSQENHQPGAEKYYSKALSEKDSFRYYLILQTGSNAQGENKLVIAELELYGNLT